MPNITQKRSNPPEIKKIYLGSDHAGFGAKEKLKKYLEALKFSYEDLGTYSSERTDYPDYALVVAEKVAEEKNSRGILICGTGTGMVIAANKVKGIRAVAVYDNYSAKMSRLHNDANILALRGRFFPLEKIKKIVAVWLKTPFSKKSRYQRRIDKIKRIESQ